MIQVNKYGKMVATCFINFDIFQNGRNLADHSEHCPYCVLIDGNFVLKKLR